MWKTRQKRVTSFTNKTTSTEYLKKKDRFLSTISELPFKNRYCPVVFNSLAYIYKTIFKLDTKISFTPILPRFSLYYDTEKSQVE